MRLKISLIALSFLILVSGTVIFINRWAFTTAPWQTYRSVSFPVGALPDGSGGVIVSDHGGRRLMRIDRRGTLSWLKEGGRRSGGFYVASLLEGDGAGGHGY